MTLHKPQKDSPSTYLTVGIDGDDTTLTVADSNIFKNQPGIGDVTRLTLGFDTATTETVTVVSYETGNAIKVKRGTPSYSWGIGTKIARVFTSYDLSEIHLALSDLNAKIQNRRRRVHLSSMTNGYLALAETFVHGARLKYATTISEAGYANFHGVVPKDFLSDGILYVLISNFISFTAVNALINVGVTRFSVDPYLGGFMELETTLNVPGVTIGDPHYIIRTKAIPLANIAADDYIIGGVRLGSEAGGNEVIYQGAYLDYLADS